MKIKHILFVLLAAAIPFTAVQAQSETPVMEIKYIPVAASPNIEAPAASDKLTSDEVPAAKDKLFSAGVLIGTDIGGAIPMPLKYIPSTFNPYPQLNFDLGLFAEFRLHKHWSLGANLIYKTVGMKADARVENQKYEDSKQNALQYYTGTAKMDMSFTMLEVPIYAKYTFNNQVSKLLFGGYFAYNIKAEFETLATNGYIGSKPDQVQATVNKGDDPINMTFTSSLRDFDAGLMLGYEHTVYNRLNIGIRVSMGLADIFQSNNKYFDYKMLQMRGSIVVGYRIIN